MEFVPDETWAAWHRKIDELLDQCRPRRYDTKDKSWYEDVIGYAANTIPNQYKVIRVFVEQDVARREAQATRTGNEQMLRYADGVAPLCWFDIGRKPFAVGSTRIRLDDGTPDDYEQCVYEQRSKAKANYDRVIFRTSVMEELARTARMRGVPIVAMIGDLPIRDTGEPPRFETYDEDDAEGI